MVRQQKEETPSLEKLSYLAMWMSITFCKPALILPEVTFLPGYMDEYVIHHGLLGKWLFASMHWYY